MALAGENIHIRYFTADDQTAFKTLATFFLCSGVICDFCITGFLTLYLSHVRNGLMPGTESVVEKILTFMATRGILILVFQLLDLILYLTIPEDFLWLIFFLCLQRVYSITFLSTLNRRNRMRQELHEFSFPSFTLSEPSLERTG